MRSINLRFTKFLNETIGGENEFIWLHNKEFFDFRDKTKDQIVLMSKGTWDKISTSIKQNLNSLNIVITRDRNFTYYNDNVNVVYDLDWYINEYVKNLEETRELWIIGDEQIINQVIKYVDTIEVFEVNEKIKGNIIAPKIDYSNFSLTDSSDLKNDSFSDLEYFKTTYKRISKSWLKRG